VRCVNENRKKCKCLRLQAANHGCHCFDRAFLLAGACVCCVKFSYSPAVVNALVVVVSAWLVGACVERRLNVEIYYCGHAVVSRVMTGAVCHFQYSTEESKAQQTGVDLGLPDDVHRLVSLHSTSLHAMLVLAVFLSGNALALIKVVAVRRARLVLGWVTVRGYTLVFN